MYYINKLEVFAIFVATVLCFAISPYISAFHAGHWTDRTYVLCRGKLPGNTETDRGDIPCWVEETFHAGYMGHSVPLPVGTYKGHSVLGRWVIPHWAVMKYYIGYWDFYVICVIYNSHSKIVRQFPLHFLGFIRKC